MTSYSWYKLEKIMAVSTSANITRRCEGLEYTMDVERQERHKTRAVCFYHSHLMADVCQLEVTAKRVSVGLF